MIAKMETIRISVWDATNIYSIKNIFIILYPSLIENCSKKYLFSRLFARGISKADEREAIPVYSSLDPKHARSSTV